MPTEGGPHFLDNRLGHRDPARPRLPTAFPGGDRLAVLLAECGGQVATYVPES